MPSVQCPKCGHANSDASDFCTKCHAILIRHCPNCWHRQRDGEVCEKCGTCFALSAELALERSLAEDARVQRDHFKARVAAIFQIALLPFTTLGGLLRALIMRLIASRLLDR
jgi:uncharacterized membrane protein YvbJ